MYIIFNPIKAKRRARRGFLSFLLPFQGLAKLTFYSKLSFFLKKDNHNSTMRKWRKLDFFLLLLLPVEVEVNSIYFCIVHSLSSFCQKKTYLVIFLILFCVCWIELDGCQYLFISTMMLHAAVQLCVKRTVKRTAFANRLRWIFIIRNVTFFCARVYVWASKHQHGTL